jgi:transposase
LEQNLAAERNSAPRVPVAVVIPEEDLDVKRTPEPQPQPKDVSEEYNAQLAELEQNLAAERNSAPKVPVAVVIPEEDLDAERTPEPQPQPKDVSEEYNTQLAELEKNLAAERNPAPEVPVAVVIPEEDLDAEPEPQPENTSENVPSFQRNISVEGQLPYIVLENARPKSPTSQAEKLDEDAANQENILTAKAE